MGYAGFKVKVVYVPGDQKLQLAQLVKPCNGKVPGLGFTFSRCMFMGLGGRPLFLRVHALSGPLKSGRPDSVLMPAPVNTAACRDSYRYSARG